MQAAHSIDHPALPTTAAEPPVARPRARASVPNAPGDSIGWLFVMPITLALLVAFTILFPLR